MRTENTFQKVTSEHEPSVANETTFFRVVKEHLQNCLSSSTGPTEPHVLWLWIPAFFDENPGLLQEGTQPAIFQLTCLPA